ncbi:MAG: MASE1 domain-containing protein [Acidobacteriota bacterium]
MPDRRLAWRLALVAVAYVVAGRLGQQVAIPPGNVTAVWPPSGIALAAAMLFGAPVALPVWLASVVVNAVPIVARHGAVPALLAGAGTGIGAAAQAVFGAWLLRRIGVGKDPLTDVQDVFRFAAAGAVLSSFVSPTIGTTSLCVAGVQSWSQYETVWWTWWLGDATGVIVAAPVVLAWALPRPRDWDARKGAELGTLLLLLLGSVIVAFGARPSLFVLPFPLLVLLSIRYGQRGASAALLAVASAAVWSTARGVGPFASTALTQNAALLLLQVFVAGTALTALVLSAVFAERRKAEPAPEARPVAAAGHLDAIVVGFTGMVLSVAVFAGARHLESAAAAKTLEREVVQERGSVTTTLLAISSQADVLASRLVGELDPARHQAIVDSLRLSPRYAVRISPATGADVPPLSPLERGTTANDLAAHQRAAETAKTIVFPVSQLESSDIDAVGIVTAVYRGEHWGRATRQANLAGTIEIDVPADTLLAPMRGFPSSADNLSACAIVRAANHAPPGRGADVAAWPIPSEALDVILTEELLVECRQSRHATGRAWQPWGLLVAGLLLTTMISGHLVSNRTKTLQLEDALTRLRTAQAQLVQSEKMASLGQVVAGVAHEINNPTNFIAGASENLATRLGETETFLFRLMGEEDAASEVGREIRDRFAKLKETVGTVKNGADRVKKIVLGLRSFSRLDEADLKPVDLVEGIDSTLALLEPRLKGIDVRREHGPLPPVACQAAQINQVLMNLLVNAVQAIESAKRPGVLTIRTSQAQASAIIEVADNGTGMSPETAARVFDPFFTTKPVGQGTGLGLAISYGVIEKHGGRISVTSQLGEGTTFRIELPMSPGS